MAIITDIFLPDHQLLYNFMIHNVRSVKKMCYNACYSVEKMYYIAKYSVEKMYFYALDA